MPVRLPHQAAGGLRGGVWGGLQPPSRPFERYRRTYAVGVRGGVKAPEALIFPALSRDVVARQCRKRKILGGPSPSKPPFRAPTAYVL